MTLILTKMDEVPHLNPFRLYYISRWCDRKCFLSTFNQEWRTIVMKRFQKKWIDAVLLKRFSTKHCCVTVRNPWARMPGNRLARTADIISSNWLKWLFNTKSWNARQSICITTHNCCMKLRINWHLKMSYFCVILIPSTVILMVTRWRIIKVTSAWIILLANKPLVSVLPASFHLLHMFGKLQLPLIASISTIIIDTAKRLHRDMKLPNKHKSTETFVATFVMKHKMH